MTFFPDKRSRYAGAAPWDFAPAAANAGNRTKAEAKTTLATRVADTHEQNEKGAFVKVPGNMSAGTHFRKTTARHSEEPEQSHPEQPQSPPSPECGHSESLTKSSDAPKPVSPVPAPSPVVSSDSLTRALMSGDAPKVEGF